MKGRVEGMEEEGGGRPAGGGNWEPRDVGWGYRGVEGGGERHTHSEAALLIRLPFVGLRRWVAVVPERQLQPGAGERSLGIELNGRLPVP